MYHIEYIGACDSSMSWCDNCTKRNGKPIVSGQDGIIVLRCNFDDGTELTMAGIRWSCAVVHGKGSGIDSNKEEQTQ